MFPFMENRPPDIDPFRERMTYERKQRGWSQAEVAEMLTARGVDKMHHTTVAKIEGGDREVKLDEAAALADLYGLSLDEMLGRNRASPDNEVVHGIRVLRDQARLHQAEVRTICIKLANQAIDVGYGGVPADVADDWSAMTVVVDQVYTALEKADQRLNELMQQADRILTRLLSKQRKAKK
jgi:transcriptional regulator with XRE-family HTH domain